MISADVMCYNPNQRRWVNDNGVIMHAWIIRQSSHLEDFYISPCASFDIWPVPIRKASADHGKHTLYYHTIQEHVFVKKQIIYL